MPLSAVLAVLAVVGLAACDNGQHPAAPPYTSQTSTWSATPQAMPPFGTACPSTGTGPDSFTAMADAPVVTAATGDPLLTTFVTAVRGAGLEDQLNGMSNITVFAPTNAAFDKLPPGALPALLDNRDALIKMINYSVVGQPVTPPQLATGSFKTVQGGTLTTSGSGQDFTVNGAAHVLCGNVRTANATVYIVDAVQLPTS